MSEPASKEAIFFAVLEKPKAEERTAFLAEACAGDEGLRRQVERLLDSHSRVGGFLERPVQEAADGDAFAAANVPRDAGPEQAEALRLDFLTPSRQADALGRLGHYEVLQVLGNGGMGVVLRAFDEKLHRVVAIKTLTLSLAAISPARRRFVREARSAASVIHDNIIAIHAVEDAGPVPYLVMPFVDGPTLQQKIESDSPLPVVTILRLGLQTASGLAAAHAQGLVHRDVKPSNILLENGVERVKITDFGLARTVDEPSLTQPGVIAGTPAYMSPEQANGAPIDHRSDLFSLGSVLYALCTGHAPFRSTTMMAVLRKVCDETPRPVREINPDIPDWLQALIAKLHAKNPAGRPQSATEVVELFGRRLADLQQPSRTSVPPEPKRRSASRWLAVAAAIVLVLVGLGATEATGVTNVRGTVVRLLLPDGTLLVEVDDPAVSVTVEGTDLVITGAGVREIRLKPGDYQVKASKDGKVVKQELVTVSRDGRPVVRISKETAPVSDAERWEQSVAFLSAEGQVRAVARRLMDLNPGFDGKVTHKVENDEVVMLKFQTDEVDDLSPLHALRKLRTLFCNGSGPGKGKLSDLSPLRGLSLDYLDCHNTRVDSLEPLRGMPMTNVLCGWSQVADLDPLKGMPLIALTIQETQVSDLTPLNRMPLKWLDVYKARKLTDLSPLKGLPLEYLNLTGLPRSDITLIADLKAMRRLILEDMPITDLTPLRGLKIEDLNIKRTRVTDLTPIKKLPLKRLGFDYQPDRAEFLRSLTGLEFINDRPAAEFWKSVEKK